MKNKKLVYILLPLTIIVWGLVIFRIINMTNKEDVFVISEKPASNQLFDTIINDNFTIQANYRDPFVRNVVKPENKEVVKNPTGNKTGTGNRNIKRIRWPQIQYNGIIENNEQNEMIAILNIDNKNCLLKAGSEMFDVKVKYIYIDSIQLEFQDEMKTIIKAKN